MRSGDCRGPDQAGRPAAERLGPEPCLWSATTWRQPTSACWSTSSLAWAPGSTALGKLVLTPRTTGCRHRTPTPAAASLWITRRTGCGSRTPLPGRGATSAPTGCNRCRHGVQRLHPNRTKNHPGNRPPPPLRAKPRSLRAAGRPGSSSLPWAIVGSSPAGSGPGSSRSSWRRWPLAGGPMGWRPSPAPTPPECGTPTRCSPRGSHPASSPRHTGSSVRPGRRGAASATRPPGCSGSTATHRARARAANRWPPRAARLEPRGSFRATLPRFAGVATMRKRLSIGGAGGHQDRIWPLPATAKAAWPSRTLITRRPALPASSRRTPNFCGHPGMPRGQLIAHRSP